MSNNLPENVFPISYAPTEEQANDKGNILWYANGHGWYISGWNYGYMPDTSHWTYMPEDLNIPSEAEKLKAAMFEHFTMCLLKHALDPDEFDLAKQAFYAGWERGPA